MHLCSDPRPQRLKITHFGKLPMYECGWGKNYQCHGTDGLVCLAPLEMSLWIHNFNPWKFVDIINCIKKKSRKCRKYGKVVCGLDGKTYDNHCTLNATRDCKENLNIEINHYGKCKGKDKNISKKSIQFPCLGRP